MRITTRLGLVLFALVLASQPLRAQGVDLTDNRTAEEKWTRSMVLLDFAWIGFAALGESVGRSPEEVGEWIGKWGGPSWGAPGSRTLQSFMRGMFLNYNMWEDLQFEILRETESQIQGRMNVPFASFFGETGERYGVTIQELQTVLYGAYESIADYLGFDMVHQVNGDWVEFTVTTK